MKKFFLLGLLFLPLLSISQVTMKGEKAGGPKKSVKDTTSKPPITDYKIISIHSDTTFVDTSLTIRDEYRFNYLRKDNFELLPFSNVGRPYNNLSFNPDENEGFLVSKIGAHAKQLNFMDVSDISYSHVPTPVTELMYKTVFEQGQILDAFFTINTSPRLNFSAAYKGVRSLGKYQHTLSSSGNFRATLNYETKNGRYKLKTHFVSQDLLNEENGGLQPLSIEQYLSGDKEYLDRSRLEVNFEDAENTLFGKRFFMQHSYQLTWFGDSKNEQHLAVGHVLNFNDTKYLFQQATENKLLGPSFEHIDLRDQVKLRRVYNEGFVDYSGSELGNLRGKVALSSYNYEYNSVFVTEDEVVENRLKGTVLAAGSSYSKAIGKFDFFADAMFSFSDDVTNNYYKTGISFDFGQNNSAQIKVMGQEQTPNFNFLLYQSDYINYNWQTNFSNEIRHTATFDFQFPSLLNLSADYSLLKNYAYFGLNTQNVVKPIQFGGDVNVVKVKAQREFKFGKFALDNTLLFQKVLDGEQALKLPSFVTRNTFYYSDFWFHKALYLQTGLTFKYFTNYYLDGYDPVLAEFYVQDQHEFEGFPRVDFFFNAKIRQARIFFKLEQLNTLLMVNDDFAALSYPYRDFAIRFGLVWNFFM